ncbi:FemAB family XrtA/PEP-CTERM system-associated protein [Reinekea sp. G2M2-21]|uniref:FemAB family XrtA/PEP-CTERM system-associated protein n=1 Tax=Reinekea sp. G2M2-21 TaxID=2788942 RepID=UPI0018AB3D30|nr:FemAB family XrtA/PEP-CTERM system-associated protein [Reinekea sp. G2M2-21]
MNAKDVLAAPHQYLPTLALVNSESQSTLLALSEKFTKQKKALKSASKQKKTLTPKFKQLQGNPESLAMLKAEMAHISASIKEIELQLKETVKQTEQLIAQAQEVQSLPSYPPCFDQPTEHYNGSFTIAELDDSDRAQWNKYLKQNIDLTNTYQLTDIFDTISSAFKHPSITLIARSDDNQIIGGLTLTAMKSRLFGEHLVSTPFFNYGGPASRFINVSTELIRSAAELASRKTLGLVEIRTTFPSLPFPCSDKKVSMVRRLESSTAELNSALGTKVRAQIKKANDYNPKIRFGGLDLLDDYYAVFSRNMRDLGTPVYGKKWFRLILECTSLDTTVAVAYVSGKPVSCGFLLGHNNTLEIPWASTLKSANHMNINMWTYHQILEFSVKNGYQFFDFGRSTKDAPTYRFKKQWGAEPIPHYWYYPGASETINTANPDNPKYKLLITIWKRLPLFVTNLIGPTIIKSIP